MPKDIKKALERLSQTLQENREMLEKSPRQDDDTEIDAADQWLKEQEAKPEQEKVPLQNQERKRSTFTDWKPREDYSPEEKAAIDKHVADGYSHREAEHLAGAYKGPKTFDQALHHTVKPSMPSDKNLSELKELASDWLSNHERHEKLNAEADKNPIKHAAGKMLAAHEDRIKGYHDQYADFLESDEVKNLKGLARIKKVQEWKNKYKTEVNPDHDANISKVSEAQRTFKEADEARKQSLDEMLDHIARGGASMPSDTSYQEAAQSIGGEKNEDNGYVTSTKADPAAAFAANNKKFTENLAAARKLANQDQLDRMKRVDTAKAAKPATIIRRRPGNTPEGQGNGDK
jgi:hypothetical protein